MKTKDAYTELSIQLARTETKLDKLLKTQSQEIEFKINWPDAHQKSSLKSNGSVVEALNKEYFTQDGKRITDFGVEE